MKQLRFIADALEKVTADGVITIEENKTSDTVIEVVEGAVRQGYIRIWSPTTRKWKLSWKIRISL